MIKAFLFDYDGVITAGVQDGTPTKRLAKKLDIDLSVAEELIESVWRDLSKGLITEAAAWQKIEHLYGKPLSAAQRDIWFTWEGLTPLPEMLALIRELKTAGYPVGLISNILTTSAELIREHGGYDEFDFVVLSCYEGVRKPEAAMYERALAHLKGTRPEEVLFLDDRAVCTKGAAELGMQTMTVSDQAQAIAHIRELIK